MSLFDLKPCPFCGASVRLSGGHIHCQNCGAKGPRIPWDEYLSKDLAPGRRAWEQATVDAWNARNGEGGS